MALAGLLAFCALGLVAPLLALWLLLAPGRWPRWPAVVLLLGGPLLAGYTAARLEAVAQGPPVVGPTEVPPMPDTPASHVAYTDRGRPVLLLRCPEQPRPVRTLAQEEAWLRQRGLAGQLIRTGPACSSHVCHDWVFTGGRYAMTDVHVGTILSDNGYRPVPTARIGDLAVYWDRPTGAIAHTGVVRVAEKGLTLVESKWGSLSRYLHRASVYGHPSAVCVFYRSERAGHLLCGVEDTPAFLQTAARPQPSGGAPEG